MIQLSGESARGLFEDAQAMLDKIIAEHWLQRAARSACGAAAERRRRAGPGRQRGAAHPLPSPAGQEARGPRHLCWRLYRPDGEDWIGGFAVGIHGIEPHLERFRAENDDYSDILLKALADRLAEAFAERLHQHVRESAWGYAGTEHLTNVDLIRETYHGIRPAPGYPACPDHSLKPLLFQLLGGEPAGVTLTDNFASCRPRRCPASISATATASISGLPRSARTSSPTMPPAAP